MRNDLRVPEIIQDMQVMRDMGFTLKQISEKYSCSAPLVKKLIGESVKNVRQDMTGQNFKTITVLRRASKEEVPWKSHETPYWVKCNSCNREWIARKGDLFRGCLFCEHPNGGGRGNYNHEMIGKRFGFLVVNNIDRERSRQTGCTYWICDCDCGNTVSVRGSHLLGQHHSHTISCGCYSKSAGELKIEQILTEYNVNFEEQFTIPNFSLYSKFDFAIFDDNNDLIKLIEYDGEQHFKSVEYFGGDEQFKIQQERDARKGEGHYR